MAVSVKEALLAKEGCHKQYLVDLERAIDSELRDKWNALTPLQVTINPYLFSDDDEKAFALKYGRGGWELELQDTNHGGKILVLTPKAGFPIEGK